MITLALCDFIWRSSNEYDFNWKHIYFYRRIFFKSNVGTIHIALCLQIVIKIEGKIFM